jgi:NADPH:quinone reductase-like Zn-dependent oxidoreductase
MKAVIFDQIGPPMDVLKLADIEIGGVAADKVLVKMLAAPSNPGDFLFRTCIRSRKSQNR